MPPDLQTQALGFLASHNTMSLATHSDEGPWAASVFFANDGFSIYFLSSPHTRHGRNLLARPEVAASVNADERDWDQIRGIQLEGLVETLIEPHELAHAMEVYRQKFPFVRSLFEFAQQPGSIFKRKLLGVWAWRLTPRRLYYLDNRLGFGQRTEVPLGAAIRKRLRPRSPARVPGAAEQSAPHEPGTRVLAAGAVSGPNGSS